MQSFVLSPACHAGTHVGVGIAGPHRQSRALSTCEQVSAPARYRALRIRFDPPSHPPPRGGSRVHLRVVNPALNSSIPRPTLTTAARAPPERGPLHDEALASALIVIAVRSSLASPGSRTVSCAGRT